MMFPSGTYTVLVTPFNDDIEQTVNYKEIEQWYKMQSNSKITGLVSLGTTSESPVLDDDEKLKIVKYIYDLNSESDNPKYLIAGIGGNNTIKTLQNALKYKNYCDAFMVTVPEYNKPTQEGIIEHFKFVCKHVELKNKPVIMYNIPSRTGVNATPETINIIFTECKNILAIKEASGSIDQLIKIRTLCPDLLVFSGDDKLILDFGIHGGAGVISVASNVIPNIISEIVNLTFNDIKKAMTLYYNIKLPQFIDALFCETNPIPVKYMMYLIGLYKNYDLRLPMLCLTSTKHKLVETVLDETITIYMHKYLKYSDISAKLEMIKYDTNYIALKYLLMLEITDVMNKTDKPEIYTKYVKSKYLLL